MSIFSYLRDKREVTKTYKAVYGRPINWRHPIRYTEKLAIFKISQEAEKLWSYVDKIEVRKFVSQQIGNEYLTKLYGTYNSPEEIDFDKLPNSFVLKTTHGSGWNIIVPDKSKLDFADAKKKLAHWMTLNYYDSFGRERQYKLIKPRILCEEYLETKDKDLYDFKFYCFHGVPKSINVIRDRSGRVKKSMYEIPWKKSEMKAWDAQEEIDMEAPKNLGRMLKIAKKLSTPFEQVRVDLYELKGRIIFGELTFSSGGGMSPFDPDRFDEIYGAWW
ncbi:MAG TPA: ATP-grasp fold amidoligase family protein [Patescibacteria group bacterium]|nr:ATP-grasp fold amidoligase family protein [Patescibacteria group bacterium]